MICAMISESKEISNECLKKVVLDVPYYGGSNFKEITNNIIEDLRTQSRLGNSPLELKIENNDNNIVVKQYVSKDKYIHVFEYPMFNFHDQYLVLTMSDF